MQFILEKMKDEQKLDYSDLIFFLSSFQWNCLFQQPATAAQIIHSHASHSTEKKFHMEIFFDGRIRSIASIFMLLLAKNVYKMEFFPLAFEHVIEFLVACIFVYAPFWACIDAYFMNNDSDDADNNKNGSREIALSVSVCCILHIKKCVHHKIGNFSHFFPSLNCYAFGGICEHSQSVLRSTSNKTK